MSTTQRPPIAEEIARRLAAALRGAQLYAPDHPIVKRNVSALAETMTVALGGQWCRACSVTATVTVEIPAIDVPFAGTIGSFTHTTSSTARVDDFRSLGGEASP